MDSKKYVSYDNLVEYDALMKSDIEKKDTAVLNTVARAYETLTGSEEKLESAKTYTDEKLAVYEFVTTDDIDTICGSSIVSASEVSV